MHLCPALQRPTLLPQAQARKTRRRIGLPLVAFSSSVHRHWHPHIFTNHFLLLRFQDGASTSNNNIAAMANTDSTGSGSNGLSNNPLATASSGLGAIGSMDDIQPNGPMGLSASDLSRLISDPSLTAFLYGRMPSLFNQLEMAHLQHRQRAEQEQRLLAAAEANKPKHSTSAAPPRSPSPVMSEEDAFRLCLARIEPGKPCQPDCQIYPHEHYHCRSDGCVLTFK